MVNNSTPKHKTIITGDNLLAGLDWLCPRKFQFREDPPFRYVKHFGQVVGKKPLGFVPFSGDGGVEPASEKATFKRLQA